MPRNVCWTGWTTPSGGSLTRWTSAAAASSLLCCAHAVCGWSVAICPRAMAALNGGVVRRGGRGVPAVRPWQLRLDRRQPVAALGERSPGRAAPTASRAAARGTAAGQPARAGYAGGTARGADRGGGRDQRAVHHPGCRRFPNCAIAPICCNGRGSRCRWRMWTIFGCFIPIRWRC